MRIIFATGNKGKLREINDILKDLNIPIVSLKDAGITSEPEETGVTFEENAVIKAKYAAEILKYEDAIFMADDSGLEVDALGGEPGVYSARYMGEETPYSIKNKNIIDRLDGIENDKRTARFVCAIAAVLPDGSTIATRGTIEGKIGYEERGANGFGYDPIFYLPDMSLSTAELSPDEKNKISHRGKALEAMKNKLKEIYK